MLQAVKKHNDLSDDTHLQYMSLSLGDIQLLTLQSHIVSIESLQDIDRDEPSQRSIGWIHFDNHIIPVYSFTERLELEQAISLNKNICAVIKDEDTYISLMCLEATPFEYQMIKLSPLPESMQAAPCPIGSLCLYRNTNKSGISFTVNAKSIVKYVNECGI